MHKTASMGTLWVRFMPVTLKILVVCAVTAYQEMKKFLLNRIIQVVKMYKKVHKKQLTWAHYGCEFLLVTLTISIIVYDMQGQRMKVSS